MVSINILVGVNTLDRLQPVEMMSENDVFFRPMF